MKPGSMRRAFGLIALFAPLFAILAATVWFAVHSWTTMEGPPMPLAGYIAMAAGVILTFVVGVGLMSLLFYSRRHGYDDAAGRGRDKGEE